MRSFAVLTLSLALIILALLLAIFSQYSIIREPEFIELYFTNPNNLPSTIPSNNIIEFSFSINNKGFDEEFIEYIIKIKNNEEKIVSSNLILIEPKKVKTIKKKIEVDESLESATIAVELPNKNQEIHFWVSRNDS